MKGLRQIKPYVAGAQPQDKKMIKINTNENAFPPSSGVLKALADFDGRELRKYSSLENNDLRGVLEINALYKNYFSNPFLNETTLSFNEDEPTVINKNKTNRLLTANFSKSVITLSNLKALVTV